MMKTKLFLLATAFSVPVLTEAQVSIQDVGGWFESDMLLLPPSMKPLHTVFITKPQKANIKK